MKLLKLASSSCDSRPLAPCLLLQRVTINDFNPAEELAVTNSRVDGLEARLNNFEAGSFSETTSASFGSNFYVGAVESSATGEAVTFSYDFSMGHQQVLLVKIHLMLL